MGGVVEDEALEGLSAFSGSNEFRILIVSYGSGIDGNCTSFGGRVRLLSRRAHGLACHARNGRQQTKGVEYPAWS